MALSKLFRSYVFVFFVVVFLKLKRNRKADGPLQKNLADSPLQAIKEWQRSFRFKVCSSGSSAPKKTEPH